MEREIRFRAKDYTGSWQYGFIMAGKEEAIIVPVTLDGTLFPHINIYVEPETIGQYTGVHDVNGKDIYEGDFVRVSDWTSVYASEYKGTVCFKRGQWVVSYEKYSCEMTQRLFFDDFSDRKTTIIGNIHELPTK